MSDQALLVLVGGIALAIRHWSARRARASTRHNSNLKPNASASYTRAPTVSVARFDARTDARQARQHLREHGFCVFAGVANQSALSQTKTLFWDWLESHPDLGLRRGDADSLQHRRWRPLSSRDTTFRAGLISQRGIGQSEMMW